MFRVAARALFSTKKTLAEESVLLAAKSSMSSAQPLTHQSALSHNMSISQKRNAPLPAMWSKDEAGKFNLNASYTFLFHKENQSKSLKFLNKRLNTATEIKQVTEQEIVEEQIEAMNRNARRPKKANKGARPCSHVARRARRIRRHSGW